MDNSHVIQDEKLFAGERINPKRKTGLGNINYQFHLARYEFARQFVKGKTVLDTGCGAGYGSAFLADSAKEVVGIDISAKSIKYAKTHYRKENLKFKIMDVTNMDLFDRTFDIVCSFELIEHIENYERYLLEIRRVLKSNGIFIASTPNKKIYSSGMTKPKNPFHVKEFTLDEFQRLLIRHFRIVHIFAQQPNLKVAKIKRVAKIIDLLAEFGVRLDFFKIRKLFPHKLRRNILNSVEDISVEVSKKIGITKNVTTADCKISEVPYNELDNARVFVAVCKV
jgi:2-polyprenyl-3-methyl-5-hydroxy-6-metoxy-1,4-benzoquinol methylase